VKGELAQAQWLFEVLDAATNNPDLTTLRSFILEHKTKIENEAVDLTVDGKTATITTLERGKISLRKQFILMDILKCLANAHRKEGDEMMRSLNKEQLITQVWKERYRPEVHDNKIYYNINRIRKMIEPDVRRPRYLLNWKEGYRLSPAVTVKIFEESKGSQGVTGTPGLKTFSDKGVLKVEKAINSKKSEIKKMGEKS
jgi:DNA-binding winged helix-turn-helix (wHTH) protein